MHLLIGGKTVETARMDKVCVMKGDGVLCLEGGRGAEQLRQLGRLDGSPGAPGEPQNSLRSRQAAEDGSALKSRRFGSRLGGVKVRHKRQVLQDMARPLKHWLYKHRDNPYPTKTEKVLLALGSHMTLVQVSNWFANARRRLKNTVRQPDLSWALRIKLYNKYIQGNAERLSVCSDASNSDDEEQTPIGQSDFGPLSSRTSVLEKQSGVLALADSANSDDGVSPPSKYKSSLLNRYLNDTLRHMMAAEPDGVGETRKWRSHSASFSSNDCDEDVVSPASSSETDANFGIYHVDAVDFSSTAKCDSERRPRFVPGSPGDPGWREIHAAVALADLAQGQSFADPPGCQAPPGPVVQRSIYGGAAPPGVRPRPALTSRIIQKSSHIAEIQTVKVALAGGL